MNRDPCFSDCVKCASHAPTDNVGTPMGIVAIGAKFSFRGARSFERIREQPDPNLRRSMKYVSNPSNSGKRIMKRYFLLGLAALGLIALVPTGSKADDGLRVTLAPDTSQTDPYYDRYRYYRHADVYRWHRYHHRHHYDRDYDRDGDRD
jgi:hypothetical protein